MIHAYCFVRGLRDRDPGGHGAPFKEKMHQINTSTVGDSQRPPGGYTITVRHSMIAEVQSYQNHVWECGRCGKQVRRAMNRKPQPADCRGRKAGGCSDPRCDWHVHLVVCGGEFVKISEPPGRNTGGGVPKRARLPHNRPALGGGRSIMDYFVRGGGQGDVQGGALPMRETLAQAAERRADGGAAGMVYEVIDLTGD